MWYSGLNIGWTDDKLQAIVKLIVGDEEFDDIGGGGDCGLFEVFPYLHDHITIRQVMDHEESDSAGSLVDFIEDDMEDGDDDEDEDDSDSSSSDYNSVVDISEESSDYDSDEKREAEVDEKKGAKKRKVIVISDSEWSACFIKQIHDSFFTGFMRCADAATLRQVRMSARSAERENTINVTMQLGKRVWV